MLLRTRGFRAWRRSRPFWGGVFTITGGAEIILVPMAPLPLMIHQGIAGIASYLMGLLMLVTGGMLWFLPQQRAFAGIATLLFALASFVTSNFGGFLIGMLLGMVGGSLGLAWVPGRPRGQAGSGDGAAGGTGAGSGDGPASPGDAGSDPAVPEASGGAPRGRRRPRGAGRSSGPGRAALTVLAVLLPSALLAAVGTRPLLGTASAQPREQRPVDPRPRCTQQSQPSQPNRPPRSATPAPSTSTSTSSSRPSRRDGTREPQEAATPPSEPPEPTPTGNGSAGGSGEGGGPWWWLPSWLGGSGDGGSSGNDSSGRAEPTPSPATGRTAPTPGPATSPPPDDTADHAPEPASSGDGGQSGKEFPGGLESPYPCVKRVPLSDDEPVADMPTAGSPHTITSPRVEMKGVTYEGVVNVPTVDEPVPAMHFTADHVAITDMKMLVRDKGHLAVVDSEPGSTTQLDGDVQLYTTKLTGKLFGAVPVTFTARTPPPLILPHLVFTDVTTVNRYVRADTMTVPGESLHFENG